jgi:probable rRNA maturation factor
MAGGIEIPIANQQSHLRLDRVRIRKILRHLFTSAGYTTGEMSLAIVDNAAIHQVNRDYLQHDYPTDVLSFPFMDAKPLIQGEVIASAEYAVGEATRYGWPAEDELLLYLVHGSLHCIGYDDTTPAAAAIMRAQERTVLAEFGLLPPGRE